MSCKGKRSMVWQFFKLTTDNQFVVCNLCKKQYKYFKNTTNLKEHLKRVHPSEIRPPREELEENVEDNVFAHPVSSFSSSLEAPQPSTSSLTAPQPSTSSTSREDLTEQPPPKKMKTIRQLHLFASSRSSDLTEAQINALNLALIKMIVSDYQPLRIVEDKGFREFVHKLNPLYPIPSRKILSGKLLPKIYKDEVDKLMHKLASVQHVAVTTDLWTSDSNIHYITVTVHFIHNLILHASALETTDVKGSQTGAQIAAELGDIFRKWGISDKIVTVVSDNGANVKSAINDFLLKHHHPCVAHTLNLLANDSFSTNQGLNAILSKCRRIVGHFKHSAVAVQKLTQMQQQMNSAQLKVKQDVATRWNSTYIMLQRLIDIKAPVTAVMSSLQKSPEMLTAEEWLTIEECVPLLKPLHLMTEVVSGEKYVTLSSIIPLVRGLQHFLNISKRLGCYEKDKISGKATFLDPRFKKQAFGSAENAENAEKQVLEELGALFAKSTITSSAVLPEIEAKPSADVDILWEYFDEKVANLTETITASPTTQAIMSVKQYLSMPNTPRGSNPLIFWEENKNLFPELYKLHEKYLSPPATSVPSERIFSKTGILTNARRNRLSPKNLNYIVFLNTNL